MAANASSAEAGREEIVVTAQRRAERILDVPISVTAVSGPALQKSGITQVADLSSVVPGLFSGTFAFYSTPTIRGVTGVSGGIGSNQPVAYYIDNFFSPFQTVTDDLLDVASVNVVKGPQGTLFGRNTTGGAIIINTRQPEFEPSAIISADYGNYREARAGFYATGRLAGNLAASLSGSFHSGDGYVTNVFNGKKDGKFHAYDVKAKLRFVPTDQLEFILTQNIHRKDNPGSSTLIPYKGWTLGPILFPNAMSSSRPRRTTANVEPLGYVEGEITTLTAKYDMGWATLASYSMYGHEKGEFQVDLDNTSAPVVYINSGLRDVTYTQEVNLTSASGGPFTYVVGIFYYNNDATQDSNVYFLANAPLRGFGFRRKTETIAGYADGTYEIVDGFFLTAGLRYSDESVRNVLTGAKASFSSATPRFVARYELTKTSNIYGSFSKGFTGGTINADGSQVPPEKINAYEIGYKYSDYSINMSLAAFYYDYTNLRFATYTLGGRQTAAAPSSEIYGGEAQFDAKLLEGLQINFNLAYTHARYTDLDAVTQYGFNPLSGVTTTVVDATNNRNIRTPTISGNLGLTWTHSTPIGELSLTGNYAYTSSIYFDTANSQRQPGYGLLNLRAGMELGEGWSIAVYGKNVTDKRYLVYVAGTAPSGIGAGYGAPATYGIHIARRF